VGIFSFLQKKPKQFFSAEENRQIVDAIRQAERQTSGEIRIFVESKNPFVDPLDRAKEIFFKLKMQLTDHRNGVLLYLAMDHHELALFADQGIYEKAGAEYWNSEVKQMITGFTSDNIGDSIERCILHIGQTLKEKFPYEAATDKNELPDDIVFGK
jgi:uncharacterized membrane protein